jgi:DNA-binding XRE family transcriptional regulator
MKKLTKYMRENNITNKNLARRLRVCPAAVYTWTSGKSTPNVVTAVRLHKLSEGAVSVYDWK